MTNSGSPKMIVFQQITLAVFTSENVSVNTLTKIKGEK